MADPLEQVPQGMDARGNVVRDDLIARDRLRAHQEAVERTREAKVIRGEVLAGFLDAFVVGVTMSGSSFWTLLLPGAEDQGAALAR